MNRSRLSVVFIVLLAATTLLAQNTHQQKIFVRHADPAAAATFEKLGTKLTFDVTNASLGDLLGAVSAKSGVTITQAPELATLPVQQARFTIHAENVPAHAVLMQALRPFELMPKPTADGVVVSKPEGGIAFRHRSHEEAAVTEANGEKKVDHVIVMELNDGHATVPPAPPLPPPPPGTAPGSVQHEVMVKATAMAGPAAFDENGRLHQEIKLKLSEDGVESEGKLVLDIQK